MKVNIKNPKISTSFKTERVYPELEDLEITPTAEEQNFKSSKYGFDNVTVKGITSNIDTDIKPENIKEGINILGVDGSYSGIDTSDATATAGDLLKDKTAYANGQQITGTIEEYDGSFTGGAIIGDPDLIPENIREGVEIFGVKGTAKTTSAKITNARYLFYQGTRTDSLNELLDLFDDITDMYYMFYSDTKIKNIPYFNTSKVKTMFRAFAQCSNLSSLPEYDASEVNDISDIFYFTNTPKYRYFTTLGGFKNLGKAYIQKTNNYSTYKLELNNCANLTHDSLMNVINNLYDLNLTYDVANGGTLYTQSLNLGSTNLAKLTAEEIAIATNKGWIVS